MNPLPTQFNCKTKNKKNDDKLKVRLGLAGSGTRYDDDDGDKTRRASRHDGSV